MFWCVCLSGCVCVCVCVYVCVCVCVTHSMSCSVHPLHVCARRLWPKRFIRSRPHCFAPCTPPCFCAHVRRLWRCYTHPRACAPRCVLRTSTCVCTFSVCVCVCHARYVTLLCTCRGTCTRTSMCPHPVCLNKHSMPCTHLGLARTTFIHGVSMLFWAGISSNMQSDTVYVYDSG